MSNTTHTHIEDALNAGAPVADPDAVLDDNQLYAGGLVPVRTWAHTRASGNALRTKRSREKAEKGAGGGARKQVSLLAPPDDDARAALREVGKRMVAGEVSADDLRGLGQRAAMASVSFDSEATKIGRHALDLIEVGGLRGRLLKHLLGYRRS
jgi:hypothetical protein